VTPSKRPRNVSKIPLPRSVKEAPPRDRPRPDSPGLRVPKDKLKPSPARPTSAPARERRSEEIGARLHSKAHEIEEKKQKIRKALKVNYSFRPQLAENTNRWLNKSTRENYKSTYEEVAVVSSAAILNFTKCPQTVNSIIQAAGNSKTKPIVLRTREEACGIVEKKENYFNNN
jgi:hypothetical protein